MDHSVWWKNGICRFKFKIYKKIHGFLCSYAEVHHTSLISMTRLYLFTATTLQDAYLRPLVTKGSRQKVTHSACRTTNCVFPITKENIDAFCTVLRIPSAYFTQTTKKSANWLSGKSRETSNTVYYTNRVTPYALIKAWLNYTRSLDNVLSPPSDQVSKSFPL